MDSDYRPNDNFNLNGTFIIDLDFNAGYTVQVRLQILMRVDIQLNFNGNSTCESDRSYLRWNDRLNSNLMQKPQITPKFSKHGTCCY